MRNEDTNEPPIFPDEPILVPVPIPQPTPTIPDTPIIVMQPIDNNPIIVYDNTIDTAGDSPMQSTNPFECFWGSPRFINGQWECPSGTPQNPIYSDTIEVPVADSTTYTEVDKTPIVNSTGVIQNQSAVNNQVNNQAIQPIDLQALVQNNPLLVFGVGAALVYFLFFNKK